MTTNHGRSPLTTLTAVLLVLSVGCSRGAGSADTAKVAPPSADSTQTAKLMTPEELGSLPTQPPDERISYGTDSSQYGELRLPAGPGPHPAHIHEGSCTQINPAPKYPLTSVVNGVSVTEVEASIQAVTSAPHAIHMHKSPEEMPVYVACADTRVPG